MTGHYYNKVEQFIIKTFTNANDVDGIKHFLRTAYWIKILRPNADEALLISAVAHDIERGYKKSKANNINNDIEKVDKGFRNHEFLSKHQNEGAEIIGVYLRQIGADKQMIDRVKSLVSKHEVGGNDDQNLLKDADSVSFFENNVELFLIKMVNETSREKVREKFDWMYNRITSEKAKEIAKHWYEQAIKKLGY